LITVTVDASMSLALVLRDEDPKVPGLST